MSFNKNKFLVVEKVISKELADFCFKYLFLKREVYLTYLENNYISETNFQYGSIVDPQAFGAYSVYGDIAMETLLTLVQPIVENKTKLKLVPTYAYARIYENGHELKKHKDRASCEISTTLNLGGDLWPIFIEKNSNKGSYDEKNVYIPSNAKGTKVNLNPGDMLIYKGYELEHWRERFNKKVCGQVFLHYNDVNNKEAINNKFDSRPHLGLPTFFSKK